MGIQIDITIHKILNVDGKSFAFIIKDFLSPTVQDQLSI